MFECLTHGKWILCGEHTVIRGGKALVFPVASRRLSFQFREGYELKLSITPHAPELETAFWAVFERALSLLNVESPPKGEFSLASNIPVGAGMGASATLCVSMARFFESQGLLRANGLYEFAKNLENLFHGQSSGVDVAVALMNQPLAFQIPETWEVLKFDWRPHFYLSYCGKPGVTSICVQQVKDLIAKDPTRGEALDKKMRQAVQGAETALKTSNLGLLKEAIILANQCFQDWGLVSPELHQHQRKLQSIGAIASKPTGSGGGGYVLSLWEGEPPVSTDFELIPAN